MAVATLAVQQYTGAGPSTDTVTTPRLSTSDSNNPGTSNPLIIPDSGLYYSFWMTLHLTITALNDATLLNNHQFYCDEGTDAWTLGTGGGVVIGLRDSGDNGVPTGSYDQATGTAGTTGHFMEDDSDGHTYYKSQDPETAEISDYTSGSTLEVDTDSHTGAEAFKGIVIQAKIDDDATRGAQAASTLTFVYDEI
jgi:hypothetical protein